LLIVRRSCAERGQVVVSDGFGLGGLPVVVFAEHGMEREEIASDLERLATELRGEIGTR
jgi:hypothetical protein